MEIKLIKEMFGTKTDTKRTINNINYAKKVLGLKGYKAWDFVSQSSKYIFENINNSEFTIIQQKAYNILISSSENFNNLFNN